MCPERRDQRFLGGPPAIHSRGDKFHGDPESFAGNRQRNARPLKHHRFGDATIIDLLGAGRPSDIARLVVPVIVGKAIYRMLRSRSPADIGQESAEVCFPLFADRYPSTTIIGISLRLLFEASSFYVGPAPIFRGHSSPERFSVRDVGRVSGRKPFGHRTTDFGRFPILAPSICWLWLVVRAQLRSAASFASSLMKGQSFSLSSRRSFSTSA